MSRIKVTNIEPQSGQEVFLTGSLTITEVLTAREVRTELTQSSVLFQSGSTQFGDTADDTHSFTGDISVTGALGITGFSDISASIAFNETEIDALQADSASFSTRVTTNESEIDALQADSGSFSTRVTTNETNISALQTDSGSLSSRVTTNETDISSLQADSASFSTRVSTNETDISALQSFSSSLDATYATDAELTSVSSSLATDVQANTAAISTNVTNIGSVTADVGLLTAETGSYATTGSNTFTEDQIISSSVLLTLQPIDPAPAVATTGSLIVSGSPAKLYIYDGVGTGWNRVQ